MFTARRVAQSVCKQTSRPAVRTSVRNFTDERAMQTHFRPADPDKMEVYSWGGWRTQYSKWGEAPPLMCKPGAGGVMECTRPKMRANKTSTRSVVEGFMKSLGFRST
uniref:Uncharacterized protein n=1 Tax=Chromera velia CCMP2878 TaxID=1169474 RepID=A0A0G4HFD1_9ALVE|eukprot:Cvel_26981.t1-p1 / transcript=Cvel_26981.t1 / gene=Cvel_26981 / organism=Chromera_velia_CCMP2878 / gene_product=hypothetical protein / transcript_product=hypothetical protein / location=Cvel_scaffold3294:11220-11968(-) / protein_length=106 / sequence_SO=supercontig / SO=protein_coding / is_pseudo=false